MNQKFDKVRRYCLMIFFMIAFSAQSQSMVSSREQPPNCVSKSEYQSERIYLDAAIDAALWIRSTAMDTPQGRVWPDDAMGSKAISASLADGISGKVIFFLEMHRATEDKKYLEDARTGADYLLAIIPTELDMKAFPPPTGFYNGVGGTAFALHNMHKATGEKKYADAALRCIELIHKNAKKEGSGIAWSHYNDLLYGNAGTGLFLLYADREMGHRASRDLAVMAGRRLLEKAFEDRGGLNWKFRDDKEFILPNFSHGAAGIGYFLATLYMQTNEKRFLEGALSTAKYLKAIARTEGGVFLVPYGWPNENWKDYYDTGWAHGPAGTARFFYRLWQITKDPQWMDTVKGCARGLRQSGLPETPEKGFGDEPFKTDRRFGIASVADFFINLYKATGDRAHRDFAGRLVEHLLKKATRDQSGMRWVYPRYVFMEGAGTEAAFTGYFYGAAGYGLLMLQYDSVDGDGKWRIKLPDDPFSENGRNDK